MSEKEKKHRGNTGQEGVQVDFSDIDAVRRAFIASEVFNRKY